MHADFFLSGFLANLLINIFRKKRSKRSCQSAKRIKDMRGCFGGIFFFLDSTRPLKPLTRSTQIPLREIRHHKLLNRARSTRDIIRIKFSRHIINKPICFFYNPSVQYILTFLPTSNFFDIGVKKHKRIPPCSQKRTLFQEQIFFIKTFRLTRRVDAIKIPTKRINAVFLNHIKRIYHIAF